MERWCSKYHSASCSYPVPLDSLKRLMQPPAFCHLLCPRQHLSHYFLRTRRWKDLDEFQHGIEQDGNRGWSAMRHALCQTQFPARHSLIKSCIRLHAELGFSASTLAHLQTYLVLMDLQGQMKSVDSGVSASEQLHLATAFSTLGYSVEHHFNAPVSAKASPLGLKKVRCMH